MATAKVIKEYQKYILMLALFSISTLGIAAQWQTVKYVIDGDTIVTSSGINVRLLSINTPEVAHGDKAGEAGAQEAKNWLKGKLLGQRVRLEKGVQPLDKYGRTLAFVHTQEGEHINLLLIENGLAVLSIYPPNTKYLVALQRAQLQAEKNKLGIWQRPEYQVHSVKELPELKLKSWGRFKARVRSIQKVKTGYKLWLTAGVYLWISNKSLPWITEIKSYKDKRIEVRGWPRKRDKNWSINIRHASQIIVLN